MSEEAKSSPSLIIFMTNIAWLPYLYITIIHIYFIFHFYFAYGLLILNIIITKLKFGIIRQQIMVNYLKEPGIKNKNIL